MVASRGQGDTAARDNMVDIMMAGEQEEQDTIETRAMGRMTGSGYR